MMFIALVMTTGAWAQGDATVEKAPTNAAGSKAPVKIAKMPGSDMFGDLVTSFECSGGYQYGVCTDGNYIYTTAWSVNAGDQFYQYDLDGNFIESFNIDGAGTIRDITFDGEYFYGAANSTEVQILDLANRRLVGTLTLPLAVRNLAYDPVRDGFWTSGNWGHELNLYDRNGNLIQAGPSVSSISGSAYVEDKDGEEHVFCFSNNDNHVYDYNITQDTYEAAFDFNNIPGITGSSGGCFIAEYKGALCFFGDIQQTPNLIGIYSLSKEFPVYIQDPIDFGTVTSDMEKAPEGQTVTLTVTPEDHSYQFKDIVIEKVTTQADAPQRRVMNLGAYVEPDEMTNELGVWTVTFTMPDCPVYVTAEFEDATIHSITTDAELGVVQPDMDEAYQYDEVTLTMIPEENYDYVKGSLVINDGAVEYTDNGDGTITFIMPDEDVFATAVFEKHPFEIDIETTIGATIVPDRYASIWGEEITFEVKPMEDYLFKSTTVTTEGGETVEIEFVSEDETTRVQTWKFIMPTDNVIISAELENRNIEGREITTGDDENTYTISDPENHNVVVSGFGGDGTTMIIPEKIYDEETGCEFVVEGVDPKAFEGHEAVTDVIVENKDEVVEMDGEAFIENMPDAKLHVYQTLLKDYAEMMPELLGDLRLVTDVTVFDPLFTYSNYANVVLPESWKQHIVSKVTGAKVVKTAAAAPAKVTVECTPVGGNILKASTGVVVTAEPGEYELAATLDEGDSDYEGNLLRPIEEKTIISAYWGVYDMIEGKFVPVNEVYRVVDDCKAILKLEANSLPDELEVTINEDEVPTGISNLNIDTQRNAVYDLNGRQMQGKLQKGVYVVNGKKFVVK